MAAISQEAVAEVIKKIQADPKLLDEFKAQPSKTIEKVSGMQIPDFLEPQINKIAKEGIDKNSDPMALVQKFIKF